uniref:Uncharacterized protein n=1 Tax=Onchocerca volvulus TaxID=6282 RepID=A0A8R1TT59_ONCVO
MILLIATLREIIREHMALFVDLLCGKETIFVPLTSYLRIHSNVFQRFFNINTSYDTTNKRTIIFVQRVETTL